MNTLKNVENYYKILRNVSNEKKNLTFWVHFPLQSCKNTRKIIIQNAVNCSRRWSEVNENERNIRDLIEKMFVLPFLHYFKFIFKLIINYFYFCPASLITIINLLKFIGLKEETTPFFFIFLVYSVILVCSCDAWNWKIFAVHSSEILKIVEEIVAQRL